MSMNALFICRNNTARSQVAMEFARRLSNGKFDSGGIEVEEPDKLVKDRPSAQSIVQAMREFSIDIADNQRIKLTKQMAQGYDKIIIMAEPETVPAWLAEKPNVEYWQIMDAKHQPIEVARQFCDQILKKVGGLFGYTEKQSKRMVKNRGIDW